MRLVTAFFCSLFCICTPFTELASAQNADDHQHSTVKLHNASAAIRPSFDCSKATFPDEHLICYNSELALLDNAVAAGYRYVKEHRGEQIARSVAAPILQFRHTCSADYECVKAVQTAAMSSYRRLGAPTSYSFSNKVHIENSTDEPKSALTKVPPENVAAPRPAQDAAASVHLKDLPSEVGKIAAETVAACKELGSDFKGDLDSAIDVYKGANGRRLAFFDPKRICEEKANGVCSTDGCDIYVYSE